ncbi:hypothetical protein BGZ83_009338 [Gryganskiella cystojenkinii]|nr:hypothetical protein BGZ83_009338 [Gryganskiella cystojenkinii]
MKRSARSSIAGVRDDDRKQRYRPTPKVKIKIEPGVPSIVLRPYQRLHLEVEATEDTESATLRQNAPDHCRVCSTHRQIQSLEGLENRGQLPCRKRPITEPDLIEDLGSQMMIQPSNSQLLQARARYKERLKVREEGRVIDATTGLYLED